jgi:WS/DGAT/MGAT family acyltransferase
VRQLNSVDAQFLALDSPRQYGHFGNLMVLDPSTSPGATLTLEAVQKVIEQRLSLVPPLRWRLVEVPLGLDHGYWLDDPGFDLEFHVRELALPAPGSDAMLAEQVASIVARPLDRARPLWEIHLLHGVHGGRVAVLTKIHHAVIDGLSAAEVLGALLDPSPEIRQVEPPQTGPVSTAVMPGWVEMLGRGLFGVVHSTAQVARSLPATLPHLEEVRVLGAVPGVRALGRAASLAGWVLGGGSEPVRGFGGLQAPRTPFSRPLCAHRRFVFASIALDEIKSVSGAHGVMINDVVVSLCAGALRRWLLAHDALPSIALLAQIPVSVRTPAQRGSYGNQIMLMTAPLYTTEADPIARLRATHEALAVMKQTQRGMPPTLMVDAHRFIPPALFPRVARLSFALASGRAGHPLWNVVVSNVAGPRSPLYLAGATVLATYPVSVITDGMGINITVMSYRGSLDIGIVADRDQIPDLDKLIEYLREELTVLTESSP